MIFKSRSLLLAVTLLAAPIATAMAQQNNPTGNLGSNKSVTATPGTTADSTSSSGMSTADGASHSTATGNYSGSAMNSTTPGGTGKTVVPGNTSSQANSAAATAQEKTGTGASGSGGGSK